MLSLSAVFTACEYYDADARVWLRFGGLECDSAGVDEVDVRIRRGGYEIGRTLECDDRIVAFSLSDLDYGTYVFVVEAFDRSGHLLYDNGSGDRVFLEHGFTLVDLDIPPSPGDLTIWWTFDGSEVCGGVDVVDVVAEDPFGYVFDDDPYPCTYRGVTYDNVIAGGWLLSLRARSADNRILFRALDRGVRVRAYADNVYTIDLR